MSDLLAAVMVVSILVAGALVVLGFLVSVFETWFADTEYGIGLFMLASIPLGIGALSLLGHLVAVALR